MVKFLGDSSFVVCLSFYKSEVDRLESAPRPYVCSYMSMRPNVKVKILK